MSQHEYQFGAFTIDADRGVVLRAGEETRLRRQSFEVLVYLVERPGVLVTKDELVAAIWGNTPVTDNSLTQCLAEIRKALGDDEHEIVRTVVRRGYLFEPPIDGSRTSDTSRRARLAPRVAWTAATLLLALAGVTVIVTYLEKDDVEPPANEPIESLTAATLEDSPSIAILRLDNFSGDEEDRVFLDGFREEIAKQLGGIDRLHVVSPLSVDRTSNDEMAMRDLGRTLDVDYVLRGSVRRSKDTLRLHVQLFNATTDAQTWEETRDVLLSVGGVLDSQEAVAIALAPEIGMTMLPDFFLEKSEQQPANIAALNHFYNGLYYLRKSEFEGLGPGALNIQLAIGRFEESIAADGNWAPPHFGIARANSHWTVGSDRGSPEFTERMAVVKQHAERALEIDDRYTPALAVLAHTQITMDRDLEAARRTHERIVSLGVKESRWTHAILLLHDRRFDEAIVEIQNSINELGAEGKPALGPRSVLIVAHLCAGRYRETIERVDDLRNFLPTTPRKGLFSGRGLFTGNDRIWNAEARAYLELGERSKGLALAETLADNHGSDLPVAGLLALAGETERARAALLGVDDPSERELAQMFEAALDLGEYDLALDYLEASIPTFDPGRRIVHCDGRTDALAGNPRFTQILREIGVPE